MWSPQRRAASSCPHSSSTRGSAAWTMTPATRCSTSSTPCGQEDAASAWSAISASYAPAALFSSMWWRQRVVPGASRRAAFENRARHVRSVALVRLPRMPDPHEMDPSFVALPRESLASAALNRAADFGVSHCDVRIEQIRAQHVQLLDGALVDASVDTDLGIAVRVVLDGTWGFAAGIGLTVDEAVRVAEQAVRVAMVAKPVSVEAI